MPTSEPKSAEVSPFAQVVELGPQDAVLKRTSSFGCLIWLALPLLFIAFMLGGTAFNPDVKGGIFMGLLALAVLVGVFFIVRSALRGRGYRGVAFYKEGLSWIDDKGLHSARWEQVQEIYYSMTVRIVNGIRGGTVYTTDFRFQDQGRLHLDNSYKDFSNWMDDLQKRVMAVQLPGFSQRFENGERIGFGDFSLDKDHLYYNAVGTTWDTVNSIEFQNGSVVVKTSGVLPWARVKISKVPNLNLFLHFSKLCQDSARKSNVAVAAQ